MIGGRRFALAAGFSLLATAPVGALGQNVAEARAYACVRAAGPVTVDGRADETAWSAAPWTEPFGDIRGGAWPSPPLRTRARLLWDDAYLYVAADLEEPHLWATLESPDDTVWHDDDFEVFLDPDGDGLHYFEIEINALGTVLDLFMERPYGQGGSADLAWGVAGLKAGVSVRGTLNDGSDTDGGWSVELAIPWTGLVPPGGSMPGRRPVVGDRWRVNFSRVDWPVNVLADGYEKAAPAAPDGPHPESNWVWSPQGVIDMHRPERWGWVAFVDGDEGAR